MGRTVRRTKVFGTRVRFLRHVHGWTQAEVARRSGITVAYLRQIEEGRLPSKRVREALADVFGVYERFFFSSALPEMTEVGGEGFVSFRRRSKLSAFRKRSALAVASLLVGVREVLGVRERTPAVPDLSNRCWPQRAAERVREQWGLGTEPIRSVVGTFRMHGVIVHRLLDALTDVGTFGFWTNGRPYVLLRAGDPLSARFDLAHELGHFVLHRRFTRSDPRRAEEEANLFAEAFLVPRSELGRDERVSENDVLLIARRFGVSVQTVLRRLRRSGCLSGWRYRSLSESVSEERARVNTVAQREGSALTLRPNPDVLGRLGVPPEFARRFLGAETGTEGEGLCE